jgi:integrase
MIRKSGKKFEVWAYNPAVGRKQYVGVYAKRGPETEEGTARHAEAEAELQFHSRGRAHGGTIRAWAERWLAEFPRPEATTNEHNAANLKPFLAEFGDRKLADGISKAEAKRVAEHRPHVARTVSAMYNDATRYLEGYQAANPFARLVTEGKGRQDITPLTEQEVRRLGDVAVEVHGVLFGAGFRAMILFAAWTGCRRGELAGMRRTDLDFDLGTVHVDRQRRKDGLKLPKTKKRREIVMPAAAAAAIESMPTRHMEWLFVTPTGKPFCKGSWGTTGARSVTRSSASCPASTGCRSASNLTRGIISTYMSCATSAAPCSLIVAARHGISRSSWGTLRRSASACTSIRTGIVCAPGCVPRPSSQSVRRKRSATHGGSRHERALGGLRVGTRGGSPVFTGCAGRSVLPGALLGSHLAAGSRSKCGVSRGSSRAFKHARLCDVLHADTRSWSHRGRIERPDSNAGGPLVNPLSGPPVHGAHLRSPATSLTLELLPTGRTGRTYRQRYAARLPRSRSWVCSTPSIETDAYSMPAARVRSAILLLSR